MELKLARIPERTPIKLVISIPPDLHQALGDYAELYTETYGQREGITDLIPYMLRSFLDSDRAYARRQNNGRGAPR